MTAHTAPATENEMIQLLRTRYTHKTGNGDAWAFVPHVRNAAGFNASRTVDAIAMALWPSRGLVLHGFEIKVSRSDWLRELREPAKAEAFSRLLDYWWVVVSDASIVAAGELPDGWGLLVRKGATLRAVREPTRIHPLETSGQRGQPLPPGFTRSFLAATLRAACRVAEVEPAQVAEAREQEREAAQRRYTGELETLREQMLAFRDRENAFRNETRLPLGFADIDQVKAVGAAVRMVLEGDARLERVEERLAGLRRQAAAIVEHIDAELAALQPAPTNGAHP